MKRIIISLMVLPVLFHSGCTDKETKTLTFPGTLVIHVITVNTFGYTIPDQANVLIEVDGLNPKLFLNTDAQGNAVIQNLPMGNYRLTLSKGSYGTVTRTNVGFIGHNVPDTISIDIMKICQIRILDYNLSINSNYLIFTGKIYSDYGPANPNTYPLNSPDLNFYLSDSSNVSVQNYKFHYQFHASYSDNTAFRDSVHLSTNFYPSGTVLYTALCGQNPMTFYIFDFDKGDYYDPNIGQLSEVKSIKIP